MGPTPVYGARAEKPLQNANFAMKQTTICRLSGDIITTFSTHYSHHQLSHHRITIFGIALIYYATANTPHTSNGLFIHYTHFV